MKLYKTTDVPMLLHGDEAVVLGNTTPRNTIGKNEVFTIPERMYKTELN
jgi:hypothetical protein